jgi:hypothetical protein
MWSEEISPRIASGPVTSVSGGTSDDEEIDVL